MPSILSRALPLLALSAACTACDPPTPAASSASATSGTSAPPSASGSTVTPSQSGEPGQPKSAPTAPGSHLAPPTAAELEALGRSSNAFAVDLYGKARQKPGNLAFSPFSVTTALLLTWAGAKGETAAQMKKVLHLEGSGDRVLDVAGSLVASYAAPDAKVTLRVANRLFGEKTFAFEPPFLARLKGAFGAALEPLDFKTGFETARVHINGWVSQETNDRIKDLIPAKGLNDQTRLVLTNAIYFRGDWADPFPKEATRPAPFSTTKTDSKPVPTMHAIESFAFAATDGVKVLQLPYEGGGMAMTLVLPDAVDGLDALEARLTPTLVDGWMKALSRTRVSVSLPRLEIDPASSLSLGDALSSLGMPLAFDRDHADFTGMANPPSPADRLYVSKVFHKAFVKVDEKGTEAAGATAVVMARAGSAAPSTGPQEFKADHPFLFLLRDVRSGMILFMGRVSDPSSK
jgi:serpin B